MPRAQDSIIHQTAITSPQPKSVLFFRRHHFRYSKSNNDILGKQNRPSAVLPSAHAVFDPTHRSARTAAVQILPSYMVFLVPKYCHSFSAVCAPGSAQFWHRPAKS